MREVTKQEFKDAYVRLGGGADAGWGLDYWDRFLERPGMRYFLEEPETALHRRMMIATDFGARQYRMFFVTEDEEERLFDFPSET
ncbi:MAG TPA: hypothetical protein VNJ71_10775 [Gemmatimonadales bacterium]|nr:hypothetical protein [Gemmatimonadales bacterium]